MFCCKKKDHGSIKTPGGCSLAKPLTGLALILDIVILDQLSKWAILEYALRPKALPETESLSLWAWLANAPERFPFTSIEILPFFNLTMVWNEGISFGLFQGGGVWILSLLALAICVLFGVWLARATGWLQAISLAMIIGGAIGNIIDRFRFGAVADFFDFHALGWHYPAFNIADSAITVGIALLVFDGLFLEPKRAAKLEKAQQE